ncbi:YfhO family protein [Azonexus sp. IMCC34842]|uniref:YfhO family protein n=1 Tax=Azonexus sp. IMCC34842 TaxID=3420950 RepID=UPI003D0C1470
MNAMSARIEYWTLVTILLKMSILKNWLSGLKWTNSPMLRQALIALTIICLVFPDVVFTGSTFRMTDHQWGVFDHSERTEVYPVPQHLSWYTSGLNDPGGALFQSEPMMEFMRYNFATFNSPYWNPYSSAGALGPETLVDLKFSVFTLAYAALGGGTHVYDLLTLFFYWIGVFFVLRMCEGPLRLHPIAGITAAIFYLLNGFAVANVGSNVAQSYAFIPLCLYSSFVLIERRSRFSFAAATASYMALMSFTFLPTTISSILVIVACTAGFSLSISWQNPNRIQRILDALGTQALVGIVAFLGLAFIYLPVIENIAVTGTLEGYTHRVFWTASWSALLSLFSPSHFFESYRAADVGVQQVAGNTIFHYGVIGLGLAACSWRSDADRLRPLMVINIFIVFVVLFRVFGVPGITEIANMLPILRNLGEQYILVAVSVSLIFLVAFGTDNTLRGSFVSCLPFIMIGFAALGAALAAHIYGLHSPNLPFKQFSLVLIALLSTALLLILWLSQRFVKYRIYLTSVLMVLMFAELIADAKFIRYAPHDIFTKPTSDVAFLKANVGLARTMTLGQYATSMEAGSAYQIQEVTSLNPGYLPGYAHYFREMTKGLPKQYQWGDFLSLAFPHKDQHLSFYNWWMVSLLGVKFIILPSTNLEYINEFKRDGYRVVHVSKFTTVIENPHVFPRAFILNPQIEENGEITLSPDIRANSVTAVKISSYRNAAVTIQGTASQPSLVVLTDNWHSGWRAQVNGKETKILQVQGTFRGINVPTGDFQIEMWYTPKTLPIAIILSTIVLFFVLGTLLVVLIKKTRSVHAR